jgi:PadR family transcriptional regulator, regulatory protein PadR
MAFAPGWEPTVQVLRFAQDDKRWSHDSNMPSRLTMPTPTPSDVLRGTLDLLILKAISLEPMHGWAIAQRLEQLSRDALRIGQGSLYPALQRLEEKGWIDSDWRATDEGRRAKYYELTPAGRRALCQEEDSWRRYVDMVDLILRTT